MFNNRYKFYILNLIFLSIGLTSRLQSNQEQLKGMGNYEN